MLPLPDFIGAALGLVGAETEEPISETEIARDRQASEALRQKLAARMEMPVVNRSSGEARQAA